MAFYLLTNEKIFGPLPSHEVAEHFGMQEQLEDFSFFESEGPAENGLIKLKPSGLLIVEAQVLPAVIRDTRWHFIVKGFDERGTVLDKQEDHGHLSEIGKIMGQIRRNRKVIRCLIDIAFPER